jgi:hypothetical protein
MDCLIDFACVWPKLNSFLRCKTTTVLLFILHYRVFFGVEDIVGIIIVLQVFVAIFYLYSSPSATCILISSLQFEGCVFLLIVAYSKF